MHRPFLHTAGSGYGHQMEHALIALTRAGFEPECAQELEHLLATRGGAGYARTQRDSGFVELQGTAEGAAFSRAEMDALLALADKGIRELVQLQRSALAK